MLVRPCAKGTYHATSPLIRNCARLLLVGLIAFQLFVVSSPAQSQSGNNVNMVNMDQGQLLEHLNAVIKWYKHLSTEAPGEQPSDTVYSSNAENLAAQVVRLAFESARGQVTLLPSANGSNNGQNPEQNQGGGPGAQRYAQLENEASQRVADDQAKIKDLQSKRAKTAKEKDTNSAQIQSLQGKLALDQSTLDAIQQMRKFVEGSNAGGTGLERNINELARTVPAVFNSAPNTKSATPTSAKTQTSASSGLFGQLVALYKQALSLRSIELRLNENDDIQKMANALRTPLRNKMRETLQRGKDLSTQTGVSKDQYDALTQQFKQLSASLVPLSEEVVLLDQSRSNLVDWRTAHTTESRMLLLSILIRVGVILIAIGIIFAIAEAWRRLTFRYVHDPRRRRQFLVLRRFVMGFFITGVVVLGFVSEFSSLATFAGFVTAGIAVGLQTVLLSVAAYFFVIGRYGIRVGDRITIAGVTGDVVDLGLVRFYVMEFAPSGPELFPTGRIVVFSNSVLFQPTTPLFKQLPGTHYTWHEAVVPISNAADREALQKSLHDAVHSVYEEYSRQVEWQRAFDYNIDFAMKQPVPEQRLQFSDAGPELVVRYPVDLHRAPEIDEKIAHALMDALGKNGDGVAGVSGAPKIRTIVKV